jgi:alkylated DNA nucleotide flippase Atl1
MRDTSPPNHQAFYEQVWSLVRQVPRGQVVTYGQIAQMLPPPAEMDPQTYKAFGSRWVGSAMAACPDDVPWQRVINAQGKISDRPGGLSRLTAASAAAGASVREIVHDRAFAGPDVFSTGVEVTRGRWSTEGG